METWKIFRDATLIVILLIFIALIPSRESIAQDASNNPVYPIVSDIVKNDFRIVWKEVENDIDRKVYKINITNLIDSNRDFNLTILMNNATFSLHQQAGISTQLFELKNITGFELQPVYEQINRSCDFNATIYCIKNEIVGYNNVSFNRITWKSAKSQFLQRNAERYRENMGVILIPKKTAKDKNDGVVNATKQFMLEITNIPLKQLDDGWGNRIRLSIIDESTGSEYHPWSNLTFRRRQRIQVKNIGLANMTNYTIFLRVPYDSDMDINFKDLRFTYLNSTSNIETNLNYFRQNYTASISADMWVGRFELRNSTDLSNNNASIYMYYKNNSVVESQSNGNRTFIHFAEWNAFDSLTYWTNESTSTDGAPNEDDYFKNNWIGYHNSPAGTNNYIKESRFNLSRVAATNDGLMIRARIAPQAIAGCGANVDEFSHYTIAIENYTGDADAVTGNPTTNSITARIPDRCNTAVTRITLNCNVATQNACFAQTFTEVSDATIAYGLTNFGFFDLSYSIRRKNATTKWREGTYISATNTTPFPRFERARLHFSIGVASSGQGTTSRMAISWIFLRNHVQPEPLAVFQKEESTSGSKPLFYVNRTNWTLVRKNARVIHNINWTNNNSVAKLDRTVFETNITGTARNFTNLTNAYHAVKINITNTTSSTGFYYWKSHAYVSDKENSTNRMFIKVDDEKPVILSTLIPADTLTPTADITITDNLALSHCWYNITVQATPTICTGTCPLYFSCNTDPILSGLSDGNAYSVWFSANDTSSNVNLSRCIGGNTCRRNWSISFGGVGGGPPSAGGGAIPPSPRPLVCSKEEIDYSITTTTGTGGYTIRAKPGSEVSRFMLLQNRGGNTVVLYFECTSPTSQCNNVKLEVASISLEPNPLVQKKVKFTYRVPADAKFGEELNFAIIARDNFLQCELPLGVKVIVSRLGLSNLAEKFTGFKAIGPGEKKFNIPNLAIILLIAIITGTIAFFIAKFAKLKLSPTIGIFFGVIASVLTIIFI